MEKSKLWLCGMVRGNKERLQKSISKIADKFDGLIFVVDSRADQESLDWLNSIKKEGEIIVKKWVNDHAHSSNEVLLCGKMSYPDYFIWIDETDELNEDFVNDLRESVYYWQKNDVGMIYVDHPFVVRFHDGLRFSGSPHWGIVNTLGKVINYSNINGYKKECFLFNNRSVLQSAFLNPAKYWFVYPNFSNHTQLHYAQFGQNIYEYHESVRINYRFHCKYELGLELTLDSLIEYLQKNINNYSKFTEEMLENEISMKDLFRLKVLNQSVNELIANRFNWSYAKWKSEGKIHQGKNDGYIGVFNRYLMQAGQPTQ